MSDFFGVFPYLIEKPRFYVASVLRGVGAL